MKITLLQTDIKWKEPVLNRYRAEEMINTISDTNLFILPEMFTTGFCTAPFGAAEKADTETLQWMQSIAKKKNAAIAGSVATEENGNFYNRFYFVKPDGSYTTYNKRHLFTYANEDKEYAEGSNRTIVEYKGVRILLQICYDLRFPVFSRNKGDYDMVIYIASWPTSRRYAWDTLLKARAIENLCFVAAVNRTGNDPDNEYSGGTVLIDFMGKDIIRAEDNKEIAITGKIDMDSLNNFQNNFPALNDADKFKMLE